MRRFRIDIAFLAVLAGPLMRRFGVRFGLVFNPALDAAILAVMVVVVASTGAAAFSVLVLAGVLRIADIAATDGTTRTSINAAYQVVPIGERLAVQAVVEGIGVPVAIGATGVLLLGLNLLDLGTDAVIVFGLVLGIVWTGIAVAVYRSYTGSLADEMRRRVLGTATLDTTADGVAIRALLRSDDARDVRLGLDLLSPVIVDAAAVELRLLASDAEPEVRVRALGQLAVTGDDAAARELAALTTRFAGAASPVERRAAAAAIGSRADGVEVSQLPALLDDSDASVRNAALDAVAAADAGDSSIVERVIASLGGPDTTGSATAAVRRLGEPAVPALVAALGAGRRRGRAGLVRAAATAAATHGAAIMEPMLRDPDRAVVLAALEALEAAAGHDVLAGDVVDGVLHDAAALAARAQAARASLDGDEGSLQRALDDEIELARRLAIAALAVRYGPSVRAAVRVVDHADRQRGALGVEALDVLLSRDESTIALPLVRRETATGTGYAGSWGAAEWIADLASDPIGFWRSPWLAACARAAAAEHQPAPGAPSR